MVIKVGSFCEKSKHYKVTENKENVLHSIDDRYRNCIIHVQVPAGNRKSGRNKASKPRGMWSSRWGKVECSDRKGKGK